MSYKNKKSTKKKSKNRSSCNNKSSENNTSKLCCFSSVDYIILASTLAIALGEELPIGDVSILSSFFAVLSDELALIASLDICNIENNDPSLFISPIAVTSYDNKKYSKKKK